ncbi:MAG: glycosyltransferase family 39 protein [Nostocales cyanobacterium 94392]|nr:glycosyltransferase family 39 protein [Nostocales cyanobacterium 94392]
MSSKLKLSFIKLNFLTWSSCLYLSLFVWIVPLLLLGIGNHSLMAHDEGLYAWRSRLMYDSEDWINPWKNPHHKTPGFYWLLAVSYSLFGINEVSVRLPNMILGILSVFMVYEIGKILLTKKVAWLAAAILSVEFLWLQYSRLGTPDVPLVFLVLLGIFSLLKAELNFKHRYIWGLIAGSSFGLGFLLRSFMIFPPLIALLPYLILQHRRHHHLANPMLYLGFFLGLLPTIIWLQLSSLRFGDDSFTQLINFVIQQGSSERENNNWIYYFWHIPILTFPWSFHCLLGAGLLIRDFLSKYNFKSTEETDTYNYKIWQSNNQNSEQDVCATEKNLLILIGFPLILFIELSIFSTRLSHYSLSLYPFIALLAAVGLNWLGNIWNQERKEIEIKNIPLFSSVRLSSTHILKTINYTFATLGILILLASIVVFVVSDSDGEIRNYATIGLVLGLSWLILPLIWIARCRFDKNLISARYWIAAWLISAWLTLAVTGSFGFLSNYNPDFQAFLQQPEIAQILQNHPINFVDVDGKTGILINFYTPKHGKRVNEISQITTSGYAWISEQQASTISQPHHIIGEVQNYQLIKLK